MLSRNTYLAGGGVLILIGFFLPWVGSRTAFDYVTAMLGRGYMRSTGELVSVLLVLATGAAALVTLLLWLAKHSKAPLALLAAAVALLLWTALGGFRIFHNPGTGYLLALSGALTVIPVFYSRR